MGGTETPPSCRSAPGGAGWTCTAGEVSLSTEENNTQNTRAPRPAAFEIFKSWLRRVALVSIAVNALLGVWAVAGSLDDVAINIFVTSLLVTGSGVVALICGIAIPESRLGPIPAFGIFSSLVGFALIITAVWTNFSSLAVGRLGGTFITVAVTVAYAAIMSGVHLEGRLLPIAYTLAVAAAGFTIAVIWGFEPGDTWRLFLAVCVLLGAITLAVPITTRLRPRHEHPPPVLHCPYCGGTVDNTDRYIRCDQCGRRFRVVSP